MQEVFYYSSPIGVLEIIIEDNALVSLKVKCGDKTNPVSDFGNVVKVQLDKYFSGSLKHFDINIKFEGTVFQKKVWQELLKIPYGQTKSYKEIAEAIGRPNASRATGLACNRNPIMIIIPCHRVITKNGKLQGFAYGINTKKTLLDLEKLSIQI